MKLLKETFNLSHDTLSRETYSFYYKKIRESVNKAYKVDYTLTHHKEFHPIILSRLLRNNKYIGVDNLEQYIENETTGYIRVTLKFKNRTVVLYFVLFNDEDFRLDFEFYVSFIISYVIFCDSFNSKCSKQLTVFFYLTPFKKELHKQEKIIGTKNVNSGVTYSCIENNEICVYRKEEFLKVFFHEVIHSMGLDSSLFQDANFIRDMNNIFHVKTTNNYFEAYTEFLGVHFYLMFISFYLGKNQNESFGLFNTLLENEIYFSMYQMNKVLNHNGLSYEDLVKHRNTDLYRESSNVFAYYVLKTIMSYHNNKVFKFLKTKKKLSDFLREIAYSRKFIEETKQFQNNRVSAYLEKTMRMTIIPQI